MAVITPIDLRLYHAARAAADAVASGGQKNAYAQAARTAIGSGYRFKVWNGNTLVLNVLFAGSPPIVGNSLVLTQAQISSIDTIIDTDTTLANLRGQIESALGKMWVPGAVGRSGKVFNFNGPIVAANSLRNLTITFDPPANLDGGSVPTGLTKAALASMMYQGNDNGWYPAVVVNGPDSAGTFTRGVQHFAYVATARKASDWNLADFNMIPGYRFALDASFGATAGDWVTRAPWFVLADAQGGGLTTRNTAGNTRIQARNFRHIDVFANGTTQITGPAAESQDPNWNGGQAWGRWYSRFTGPSPGEQYTDVFGTTPNDYDPASLSKSRNEAANGGGWSMGSVGLGAYSSFVYHGYPISIGRDYSVWRDQTIGSITLLDLRLIKHNPAGPDDSDLSHNIAYVGCDWYLNKIAGGVSEAYHSSWKRLTTSWQTIMATDLTYDQIMAANLPGFS